MKSTSTLLGHLGKAGVSQSTPEEGDTRITVPGILMPIIEIPLPIFTFISAGLPAGSNEVNNSFVYNQSGLFNLNFGNLIWVWGAGVWDMEVDHWLEEQGAVSDATSTHRLSLVDTLTGTTTALSRITNKQGLTQNHKRRFKLLVEADTALSFVSTGVVGLGTGLNLYNITVSGTRLY